ncbi:hypothetical protein TNCV_3598891 [Trichonephila clavipes]|uniref:Uncharacterized protein n=1 Tax=Trichonephila inaurata madagascariensis TaxID=2747483 RepID=A0A8X6WNI3_9ARAC|nr:hypothetical protein TNCV_3598891 [Trichonephila clavipes]GFY38452.1 hypothetical protein TNIN_491401 [Trichonephila inaurata madagascariensis]
MAALGTREEKIASWWGVLHPRMRHFATVYLPSLPLTLSSAGCKTGVRQTPGKSRRYFLSANQGQTAATVSLETTVMLKDVAFARK